MPELPEVETIRRGLRQKILNKKIKSVVLSPKAIIRNQKDFFIKNSINNKFINIDRVGKLLIFSFEKNNLVLLIHLKMTGQLIYRDKYSSVTAGGHNLPAASEVLPGKFTRAVFNFSDNSSLFFNDMRRFGYLSIIKRNELGKVTEKYGFEPLSDDFNLEDLKGIIKNKNISIKQFLLNQEMIAGIGNIYADEILYSARILPTRPAGRLNPGEIKKLYRSIKKILEKAIEAKGTTFKDYADSDGKKGNFSSFLKVYGRANKDCYGCAGQIKKIKLGGRGTYFCPSCQQ